MKRDDLRFEKKGALDSGLSTGTYSTHMPPISRPHGLERRQDLTTRRYSGLPQRPRGDVSKLVFRTGLSFKPVGQETAGALLGVVAPGTSRATICGATPQSGT